MAITTVPIRNEDKIKSLPINEFCIQVLTVVNNILEKEGPKSEKLIPYEEMGYLEKFVPSKHPNKKIKTLLQKRNGFLRNFTKTLKAGKKKAPSVQ